MADYLSLKKSIFSKYLMDVPQVTGVMPTAFLISDLYHFMKSKNVELAPQKMQTVIRAWVSDPSSNAIPVNMVNDFYTSAFFGSCNQDWLQKTQNEFIITPMRSWYDSGIDGRKWENPENVTLQGINDPVAVKLFEEYKKMNEQLFREVKTAPSLIPHDPHGAVDPGVIISKLGSIYDPFIEEMSTTGKTECHTISCGYASLLDLESTEQRTVLSYLEQILVENKNNEFIIGGSNDTSENTQIIDLYKKLYNCEKELVKFYLDKNYNSWARVIDNLFLILNGLKSELQAKIDANSSDLLFDSKKIIYGLSFVANRITNGHISRFSIEEYRAYACDKFKSYIANVSDEISREMDKYVNVIDTTIYHDVLNVGDLRIKKLKFDVPNAEINKIEIIGNNLRITATEKEFNFTNTVGMITDEDGDLVEHAMYHNQNHVLVSAVNFMKQFYEKTHDTISDAAAKRNFLNGILCISYSFDFFIIDVENCVFYGVQVE